MHPFRFRDELRAAFDECVHDAMVPDSLFHVFAEGHGPEGVGPHPTRGQRGLTENRARHLEGIGRVSRKRDDGTHT